MGGLAMFDSYYKFVRLEGTKSPTRYDCTHSTHNYLAWELIAQKGRSKPKRPVIHIHDIPHSFNAGVRNKAATSISLSNSAHLTSVFFPDVFAAPCAGCGDVRDTGDALLIIFAPDWQSVEIFVARRKGAHRAELCRRYIDGTLTPELNSLRMKATPTGA